MMTGLLEANNKKNLARLRRDVPILLMCGDQDPVGDFGKGPKHLYNVYKSMGLDCRLRIYKDSRHELLNDLEKEKVCRDIVKWLDHYVDKR